MLSAGCGRRAAGVYVPRVSRASSQALGGTQPPPHPWRIPPPAARSQRNRRTPGTAGTKPGCRYRCLQRVMVVCVCEGGKVPDLGEISVLLLRQVPRDTPHLPASTEAEKVKASIDISSPPLLYSQLSTHGFKKSTHAQRFCRHRGQGGVGWGGGAERKRSSG